MKTWQEIYNKYKDTELMKEFVDWKDNNGGIKVDFWEENIKDIFGYLLIFSEMKGYYIELGSDNGTIYRDDGFNGYEEHRQLYQLAYKNEFENLEQAMLWCASKFFEVAK